MTYQQFLHLPASRAICAACEAVVWNVSLARGAASSAKVASWKSRSTPLYLFRYGGEDKSYPNNRHNGVEQPRDG